MSKSSIVWDFFTLDSEKTYTKCGICRKSLKNNRSSTSNLIRHSHSCHLTVNLQNRNDETRIDFNKNVSECSSNNKVDAFSILQSRRTLLEVKITEKNFELKQICIQEAELIGRLPPEIPLEPGETLPTIRRRVGTSFTYPECLINELNIKDDKTTDSLELEYKIKKDIANAVLKLSNDKTSHKTVRQKHRTMYEKSQQKIIELETKINLSNHQKLKIKLRPKINIPDFVSGHSVCETSFVAPKESDAQSFNLEVLLHSSNLKTSHDELPARRNSYNTRMSDSLHARNTVQKSNENCNIQPMLLPRSNHKDNSVLFSKNANSHLPLSHELASKCIDQDFCTKQKDRSGRLNKKHTTNSGSSPSHHSDKEMSSVPTTLNLHNQKATALSSNQMCVKNSLIRTNSFGNIKDKNKQQREEWLIVSDQVSESENKNDIVREWLEACFGSCSMEQLQPRTPIKINSPPLSESECLKCEHSYKPLNYGSASFRSPETHTVFQVGQFQPYYETAKPFEMSDIYKYSTRYRMPSVNSVSPLTDTVGHCCQSTCPIPPSTSHNIEVYQPSRPSSYRPLIPPRNTSLMEDRLRPVNSCEPSNEQCLDQKNANEMLFEYQDNDQSQLKGSTLV